LETQPPTPWYRLRRWIRRTPDLASHWIAMGVFFINNILNHAAFKIIDADFFLKTSSVLAAWFPICYFLHRFVQRDRNAAWPRFLWAGVDVAFFTTLLMLGDGVSSALVIGYPLLVVGSGLWFRTRLVWFTTGLVALSYVLLLSDSIFYRPALGVPLYRPVIFLVSIIILGFIVTYQVSRVHALERYCRVRSRL